MHERRPATRSRLAVAAAAAASLAGGTLLTAAGAGAGSSATRVPTWRDIAPIFENKCASCHVQGGIGAFPLTSAKDAAAHATLIYAVVRSGKMPPWMPGKDSPAFIGQSKRILTAQERTAIEDWVRGGARR